MTNSACAKNNGDGLLCSILWFGCLFFHNTDGCPSILRRCHLVMILMLIICLKNLVGKTLHLSVKAVMVYKSLIGTRLYLTEMFVDRQ